MKFLEGLTTHPALKHNVFGKEQRRHDIDLDNKILHTIQGSLFLPKGGLIFSILMTRCSEGGLQLPQCSKEFLGIFRNIHIQIFKWIKCMLNCSLFRGQWLITEAGFCLVFSSVNNVGTSLSEFHPLRKFLKVQGAVSAVFCIVELLECLLRK